MLDNGHRVGIPSQSAMATAALGASIPVRFSTPKADDSPMALEANRALGACECHLKSRCRLRNADSAVTSSNKLVSRVYLNDQVQTEVRDVYR
jgi:hypothetical protein